MAGPWAPTCRVTVADGPQWRCASEAVGDPEPDPRLGAENLKKQVFCFLLFQIASPIEPVARAGPRSLSGTSPSRPGGRGMRGINRGSDLKKTKNFENHVFSLDFDHSILFFIFVVSSKLH